MANYVVMEAQSGSRKYWAWGLVDDGPGFTTIDWTDTGGAPVEAPLEARITRHLFTVDGPAPAPSPAGPQVIGTDEFLTRADVDVNEMLRTRPRMLAQLARDVRVDLRPVRGSFGRWVRVLVTYYGGEQ